MHCKKGVSDGEVEGKAKPSGARWREAELKGTGGYEESAQPTEAVVMPWPRLLQSLSP